MNKPEIPISEELLSAYLDGEVTAEEDQLVRQELKRNEDLRHLLDELVRIRDGIKGLPKYRLPADFHARISRSCRAPSAGAVNRHQLRVTHSWRTLGVCATAATILIAVLLLGPNLSQPDQVGIAKVDAVADDAGDLDDSINSESNPLPERLDRSLVENLAEATRDEPTRLEVRSSAAPRVARPQPRRLWRKSAASSENEFDAVLTITVSHDQIADNNPWAWIDDPNLGQEDAWRTLDRQDRDSGQIEASDQTTLATSPVRRLEIEGTQEEIEEALAAWNIGWERLQLADASRLNDRGSELARSSPMFHYEVSPSLRQQGARGAGPDKQASSLDQTEDLKKGVANSTPTDAAADELASQPASRAFRTPADRRPNQAPREKAVEEGAQQQRRYRILLIAELTREASD